MNETAVSDWTQNVQALIAAEFGDAPAGIQAAAMLLMALMEAERHYAKLCERVPANTAYGFWRNDDERKLLEIADRMMWSMEAIAEDIVQLSGTDLAGDDTDLASRRVRAAAARLEESGPRLLS